MSFRLEYLQWWQLGTLMGVLGLLIVWMGSRSMAGLGPMRKWTSIVLRLIILATLLLVLGGIRLERKLNDLEVIVMRDISQSTQFVQEYPGAKSNQTFQGAVDNYLTDLSHAKDKKPQDRIGVVSFSDDALIDAMPQESLFLDTRAMRKGGNGTNVASAIQLALASMSPDAMHRLVLIWDGNANLGDLDSALSAAAAQHVPIDVIPMRYQVTNEVMVDRFIAPTWRSEKDAFSLDVVLRSENATTVDADLAVTQQGTPVDMDLSTPGIQTTRRIKLPPGLHVEHVAIAAQSQAGVHQFRAEIRAANVRIEGQTPGGLPAQGDTLAQNNTATAFTFVRGKGKALYIDNVPDGRGKLLADALEQQGIQLDETRRTVDQFPRDLMMMQGYDVVILANVPRGAGGLSEDQATMLSAYVHDMGGGLVMIGGEQAFGAGGWQGSKLEEVLPVNMDIPAQRQIAKGALVLVMHSCEMPNGDYWGAQCAIKAVEALSDRDDIGVISYGYNGTGGSQWDFPLQEKGDGSKAIAAIKKMQLGDMPSFDDSLNVALNGSNGQPGLLQSSARQKHVIVISDGDPAAPASALLQKFIQNNITITTVSVYPHGGIVSSSMQNIADLTKGKYYGPINDNFNTLPQIFIKEATIVRRSLIHEVPKGDPPFPVQQVASTSDAVKGIGEFPDIYGMVLTSRKPSPLVEIPLFVGKNQDPLLAQWRSGLGKAAVFTSDAYNKWTAQWVNSDLYGKFWSQMVRSVSRAPISTDFDIQVSQSGNKGKILVEASGKDNSLLSFLSLRGQVLGPDNVPHDIRLLQTGPGVYEATFDAPEPGNYVTVINYTGADKTGVIMGGMAVNQSPEMRTLNSDENQIALVAQRTGGRVLQPWDVADSGFFSRQGVMPGRSPLPVWDLLLLATLVMFLLDVACRRIAWDYASIRRAMLTARQRVSSLTHTSKVDSRQSVDALKRIREESAMRQQTESTSAAKAPQVQRPDAAAKFEAKETVEGDITSVLGGATDKPIPKAPEKPQPKGMTAGDGDGMSGLMEAKRRARKKMDENKDQPPHG